MKSTPSADRWSRNETRLGWALALPALGTVVIVAVFPILWTVWESLHLHDLRMPWLGRPFVGGANYTEALGDPRVRSALAHTGVFVATTLTIEITAGLILAMALEGVSRGRGLVRTAVLLPWAIPTVVAALIWRFIFESPAGLASTLATRAGMTPPTWFADSLAAWIPIVLADAWKTTPFVALLLLAGLQNIDSTLYEAAAMDGAGPGRQFVHVTLPLLRPTLLVTALFRGLDAFRVFDVVYVMTGGGPGTATEPIAVYTFTATLQNLRFGFGSALSVIVFVVAFCGALVAIRLFGADTFTERPA
jgi:ABC-type sugar transport system permease subunit